MFNTIFLNRWGHVFHVILDRTDGTTDYQLHSAVCSTLAEARTVAARWQARHHVADEDMHDNSAVDCGELLQGMETDFSPARN